MRNQGKAVRFAVAEPPGHLSIDRHMFIEDLQLRVFPSRWDFDEVSFKLDGTEEERARTADLFASLGEDHYGSEQSVISGLKQMVFGLSHHGQIFFELLRDDDGTVVGFWPFSPEGVYRLAGLYVQIVPRWSWPELGRKYVVLKRANVWRVEMPRELGGPKVYMDLLNSLAAWPSLGPNFYKEGLQRQELPKDFNFGDYRRVFEVQRYRATNTWGWNGRDWSLQYITEYYQFYRFLTFRWAQAILRKHLINEVNHFLAEIGISLSVVLEGLPSPEEILTARDRMARGEIDFAEASKITANDRGI
jgi:hypothetical protein